jgi:exosortase A-associated hydrolase 2
MTASTETPIYFGHGSEQLFGVLHEPAPDFKSPAFVFCHPFGEEKLWAHRVFVGFARELSRLGHAVLRFDCRGNGDSDAAFRDTSLQSNLHDLGAAIDLLKARRQVDSVALLGLRLGATQAALLAEQRSDISALVLWSPITDGARYMQELLRINLTTQLAVYGAVTTDREALVEQMRSGQTVNVDGYDLALPFYEQVSAVKLAAVPHAYAGPCLIVQVERNESAPPARDLVALELQYARATLRLVHEEPFWKEIQRFYETADQLFATTLEWVAHA